MESEMIFSYNKPFNSSQNNSGLLRFRSAPSSFLANWDGKSEKNEDETSCFHSSRTQSIHEVSQLVQNMEEDKALNSQFPPQYPRTKYRAQKLDLMRENSTTPAELFSPFSAQNGYASLKSVGGYGFPSGEVEFSSPVQSTLGMLSRITEVENETIGLNTLDREPPYYCSGMPFSSWNHSTKFGDNLSGLKTELDCDDEKLISDIQGGGELRNRPHMLSHHLSIPKASTHEFATMDKFLHFQDSVPCKLRAKRGCATHPRSIAERVRRTRISERMRKLQDLVPNMEKQTNTSDMLDFAVDYIKELQKQYKSLSDIRARCKCSSAMQKQPVSDQKY